MSLWTRRGLKFKRPAPVGRMMIRDAVTGAARQQQPGDIIGLHDGSRYKVEESGMLRSVDQKPLSKKRCAHARKTAANILKLQKL